MIGPAMSMIRGTLAVLALVIAAAPSALTAQEAKPVQIALFPPIQIVSPEFAVHGFRLNVIYGKNAEMKGLDVGIVNHSTGDFTGLQYGLVGITEGEGAGWEYNLLVNLNEGRFTGLQTGVYNEMGGGAGVQYGAVNNNTGRMQGLQVSLVNIGGARVAGVQLGLVNITDDMNGIQIGLVNVIESKELSVLPIVNWKFDSSER